MIEFFIRIFYGAEWRACVKDGQLVMRRRREGKWEYRPPSEEEERESNWWQIK